MNKDASASQTGLSSSTEPVFAVSALRASIPSAGDTAGLIAFVREMYPRLIRLCRERAETYGALRRSCLTAIALDRAADALTALSASLINEPPAEGSPR